jgi:hypothetical protein
MTKEKQTAEIAKWAISIIAALMFGAFLATPVPAIWADQISEMAAVISEQAAEVERLHKEKAETETNAAVAAASTE